MNDAPRKENAVQRGGFDPHTVFADILAGRLPAAFVHRDALVSAFMDIQPVTPGHVLIVPNLRSATLAELPPETGAQMFRIGQRVAAALRASELHCAAVNFFLADGIAAGQTVFHLHLHVSPATRVTASASSCPSATTRRHHARSSCTSLNRSLPGSRRLPPEHRYRREGPAAPAQPSRSGTK